MRSCGDNLGPEEVISRRTAARSAGVILLQMSSTGEFAIFDGDVRVTSHRLTRLRCGSPGDARSTSF
jgi:hypothetical protein